MVIFDKYEIIRRMAIGGMGEIFLARQKGVAGFDRLVVIKTLLPELAEDQKFVDQFLDEARVVATLNHPNIVGVYEVGRYEGVYFLAMEYIHGESVAVLLRIMQRTDERVPFGVALAVARDAARGLDHAYSANDLEGRPLRIVHRDISPHNIMMREDGVTKVVDFGIARASNRATRTKTGMLKGKLGYMAPEYLDTQTADHRADQFALGVVLWEMCAGRRLHGVDAAEMDVVRNVLDGRLTRLGDAVPDVPPLLDATVTRMLARRPEDRFEAWPAVAASLDACAGLIGGDSETTRTWVRDTLGSKLDDRVSDLTPSKENFLVSLATGGGTGTGTAAAAPAAKRRWLVPTLAVVAVAALVVAGLALVARDDPSAAPATVAAAASSPKAAAAAPIVAPPPAPPAASPPPPAEAKGKRGRPRPAPPSPQPAAAPAPPAGPAPLAEGFLTLDTTPWTNVHIDGQAAGPTPLHKRRLAPGKHDLRLVNQAEGIDVRRQVDVEPGGHTRLNLPLE